MRLMAGADWAFMRDSSALAFVSQVDTTDSEQTGGNPNYLYTLEQERLWKPGEKPLRPSVVFKEAMTDIEKMGAEAFCCDDHYLASVIEVSETYDIERIAFPVTTEGIAEAYVAVRVLFGNNAIDLSRASDQLIDELKETVGQVLTGGVMRITHKRKGHSHGDLARSFVSAIYALEHTAASDMSDGEDLTTGARRMARRGRHGSVDAAGKWRDLPPKLPNHYRG